MDSSQAMGRSLTNKGWHAKLTFGKDNKNENIESDRSIELEDLKRLQQKLENEEIKNL
jgi:hypothetical protein